MVTPVDVYVVARDVLFPLRASESAARSCISRAYYGAFLSARRVSGTGDSTAGVHREVANWFVNSQTRGHLKIGNRLNQMRDLRNEADYAIQLQKDWSRLAFDTLGLAERVLLALGETVPPAS